MRRTITAMLFAMVLSVAASAAADVTFVLNNGERHSGTIGNRTGTDVTLNVGGQQRTFPLRDVAVMIYNGGDPPRRELLQLPTTDTPAPHERHTLVLRNGQVIRGTADDWKGETLVFDTVESRQSYNSSEVARLYLVGGPRAQSLFPASGETAEGRGAATRPAGTPQATIRIEANQAWTDTGILVRAGEQIAFVANGTVSATGDRNVTAGADGHRGVQTPGSPVAAMPVGGLIARIGNGRPFPIGSSRQAIAIPANGRLFLGVNDTFHDDNTGGFDVEIYRR
jgi:PA-IL-like protein